MQWPDRRQVTQATAVVLEDYAGLTWADLAADRGGHIDAAMRELHRRCGALPAAGLGEQEGEAAGISFRVRGAGPPLMLLPLDLSPHQWEPLIPVLAARYCTITLGGPLLGSVASLEERGRSGYMAIVRGLLDALAIQPGESVLEVGCGSGVIMRELGRRTSGANRLIGRDVNPYLLREARALARRAGLLHQIDFDEGSGEALPLPRRAARGRRGAATAASPLGAASARAATGASGRAPRSRNSRWRARYPATGGP